MQSSRNYGVVFLLLAASTCVAEDGDTQRLRQGLQPLLGVLSGESDRFALLAKINFPVDRKPQQVVLRLDRHDDESFDLSIQHPEYELVIQRRREWTAMVLPKHVVAYVGRGDTSSVDHLAPKGILARLVTANTTASTFLPLLGNKLPKMPVMRKCVSIVVTK